MTIEFFPDVPEICFEGPTSKNPLAFKHYNPKEVVEERTMSDWLRFGLSGWKPAGASGEDVFTECAIQASTERNRNSVEVALRQVDVAFEFLCKLGIPYYCYRDHDVAPEGDSLLQSNRNIDQLADKLKSQQALTGVRLLSGTAELSSRRRYLFGAATSPYADVFAYAAAQVKKSMDVTHELQGQNFVLPIGKEWYGSPHDMDPMRELDHLARFIHLASDYAREIGFEGQFLFEVGQQHSANNQYATDIASCMNFVRQFGMMDTVKLNVEWNQAMLSGNSIVRVLEYARTQTVLGGISIRTGDALPNDICVATQVMLTIMAQDGLTPGGITFEIAGSANDHQAVFRSCVGLMDLFAYGLKTASKIRKEGVLFEALKRRYQSFDAGIGKRIDQGYSTLEEYMLQKGEAAFDKSDSQVFIEDLIRGYLQ